jgi:hypothetical protein
MMPASLQTPRRLRCWRGPQCIVLSHRRYLYAPANACTHRHLTRVYSHGFPQIPIYWRWITWVAPLHYIFNGLTNNEFSGASYQDPGKLGPKLAPNGIGPLLLETFQIQTGTLWRCAFVAPQSLRTCSLDPSQLAVERTVFKPLRIHAL